MLEIALDAEKNDVEIENDAILDQNVINNNTSDENLMLTNNDEEIIVDNNYSCDEF